METNVDVLIVGGGLAGCLLALRLRQTKPDLKIILIEASESLGNQRTWGFHEQELSSESLEWLRPLIVHTWTEQLVQFPKHTKTLKHPYHVIRSERLHKALKEQLGKSVLLNKSVSNLTDAKVLLEDGRTLTAPCVIDARGLPAFPADKPMGYQKFIGFDIELEKPHDIQTPIILDATCPQLDGFRSFTLLPLNSKAILIEENFYSDQPNMNFDRVSRSVRSYIERKGWKFKRVLREQHGLLPIPMTSYFIAHSAEGEPVPIGGRGGFFHSTTGNPFHDAVRVAEFIGNQPQLTSQSLRESLEKFRRPWLSRQRFYRLLNRIMFYASEPLLRYAVIQKLYELPDDVLYRFLSGRTSWSDRLRILSGKMPVSTKKVVRNLTEKAVQARLDARLEDH